MIYSNTFLFCYRPRPPPSYRSLNELFSVITQNIKKTKLLQPRMWMTTFNHIYKKQYPRAQPCTEQGRGQFLGLLTRGTGNSRGVAILIDPDLNVDIVGEVRDVKEHYYVIHSNINGKLYTICAVNGPSGFQAVQGEGWMLWQRWRLWSWPQPSRQRQTEASICLLHLSQYSGIAPLGIPSTALPPCWQGYGSRVCSVFLFIIHRVRHQ